jgi:hypothetical protein
VASEGTSVTGDGRAAGPPTHVFVVGTGRSGTTTIASLASRVPGCVVDHEREPKLLEEVTRYFEGRLQHHELIELLQRTRNPEAIGGTRVAGEANQRLSFVLPALAEAFPQARLVWLLRDGRDAVASMHHRGWYDLRETERGPRATRDWARTRVRGDVVGDLTTAEWEALDAFGRCCWYWSYTNRLIAADADRLGVTILAVKLEELERALPDLASFLGVEELAALSVPKANIASSGKPTSWRLWSRRRRAVFERLCGEVMDVHYPGWRGQMAFGFRGTLLAGGLGGILQLRGGLASKTWRLRARIGLARGVPEPPGADPS